MSATSDREARLEELVRLTATGGTDPMLAAALPVLLELSGALALLVVRRLGESQTVVAHAGADLDAAAIPDGLAAGAGAPAEVAVPEVWAGVVAVEVRRLPGLAGALLVCRGADPAELEPGLGILENGLARAHAEEQLQDLETRMNTAQQLANMGDYDWHIASDTNQWSDQLYRIYGHEPQSFNASYERFLSFIHPDDRERISAIHQQAYGTGEPYQMIERIVRPDGEVRYLSSNGQVVMDPDRVPVRMRGTCVDITDRVLAEQQREQIAVRFQNLVEASPDAILVLDAAGAVMQANGRAAELLGGDPVEHTIHEILPGHGAGPGRGLDAIGLDARALKLDVTVAALTALPDEGHVAAFLRDASPRLRSESMAARLRETQVRRRQAMEINDNVVQGLTAAVYALETGDVAASSSYLQRTLASARRMMNDLLDPLTGDELGPGDLVRAVAATLEEATELTREATRAPTAPGRRVLIADDSEDVRMLIRLKIEASGLGEVVGEAADGEEAVRLAAAELPDLVLLDLAMPLMDGLQALPEIRRSVQGVKVVVLSGFDEHAMADKALAAGAMRYVEKGVALSDLAGILDEVFASPHPTS